MSKTYLKADRYLNRNHIAAGSVFVEIGSDRGEGSTPHLASLAQLCGVALHSVDIDADITDQTEHSSLTCHTGTGSIWARDVYPTINKPICLLYLDNFDWIWDLKNVPAHTNALINQYKDKYNIVMNNENCQLEHFSQMIYLLPYLADKCVVMLDDTFWDYGIWTGKCGPVVTLLKHHGFKIVSFADLGVVMTRNYN